MEAYKYIIKISKSGTIQLPDNPELFDKEAEIIILPKQETPKKKVSAKDFFDEWGGFLKDTDIENSKYEYLMEKYK